MRPEVEVQFPQRFPEHVKIAICESNAIACELLRTAFARTRTFQVVACVTHSGNVSEALAHDPDVLLISARLADGPVAGFRGLRIARELRPHLPSVVLLDQSSPELIVDAFRAGARGVFYREDSFHNLCKCLTVAKAGQIWAGTNALNVVLNALEHAAPLRLVDAKGEDLLTHREQQVVALVVDGLNNREISQQLQVSEHTVKNHLFHTFEKLGISSRVELVLYAIAQRDRRAA